MRIIELDRIKLRDGAVAFVLRASWRRRRTHRSATGRLVGDKERRAHAVEIGEKPAQSHPCGLFREGSVPRFTRQCPVLS